MYRGHYGAEPINKIPSRYEATDMNIYRSALSACVLSGLPNLREYIYKHRDRLMEEKRLKLLAHESQEASSQSQGQNLQQQLQI